MTAQTATTDSRWLEPTWFIDSDSEAVARFADAAGGDATEPVEVARRLFYAVRDGIRYDPYVTAAEPAAYRQHGGAVGAQLVHSEVGAAHRGRTLPGHSGAARLRRREEPPHQRETVRQHMEYIRQRGSFDDLPLDEILATFLEVYPGWVRDESGAIRHGDGGTRDEAFHGG